MKRSADFGSDFTTNPEGIPTKDPRRAMRNNQLRGVWSHIADVSEIINFISKENVDLAYEASLAGASVDESSAARIASKRIDEVVGIGQAHNKAEFDLTEAKEAIRSVGKSIRDNQVLSLNPFVKKESINNSSGQLDLSFKRLDTKERNLRRMIDKTNSKLPDKFQQNPHIPLAGN